MSLFLSHYWLHVDYDESQTVKDIYVFDSMAPEQHYCTKWLETRFVSPVAVFIEAVITETTQITRDERKSQLHIKSVGFS